MYVVLKRELLRRQVADTGFDDGSCFLVDDPSTRASLTGDFNSDVQIARSLYDSPTTDLSRRKIVQYIKRSDSYDYFGYDYSGIRVLFYSNKRLTRAEPQTKCILIWFLSFLFIL